MDSWHEPHAGAIYSLGFYGDAPTPPMFARAVAYSASVAATCDVFAEEQYLQASSKRDDWVLLLHISSNSTGIFQVEPDDDVGGVPTAQVIVKHVVKGKELERHTALAGSVKVVAVPATPSDQLSGAEFVVDADVEFSTNEALQGACSVGGPVDGGVQIDCVCERKDGTTFTCNRADGEANCCLDPSAPRTTFHVSLRATPCGAACLATSLELHQYCNALGDGGSSTL